MALRLKQNYANYKKNPPQTGALAHLSWVIPGDGKMSAFREHAKNYPHPANGVQCTEVKRVCAANGGVEW